MLLTELVNMIGFVIDQASLTRANQSLNNFLHSAQSAWGEILGATLWAAPIVALDHAMIKAAASMEDLQMQFEVLLGNQEAAIALTTEVKKLADVSPYMTQDLAASSSLLMGFGVAAQEILPDLKLLGDVAMGNRDRFGRMSLAFAQVMSAGKLMGQDLLQFINAGFNPLQIISEKTGKSMAVLRKEMEAGSITSKMVRDAFVTATSEGGRFFKGMEKGASTFNGMLSTLKDSFMRLLETIGTPLLKPLKELLDILTKFTYSITEKINPATADTLFIMMQIVAVLPILSVALMVLQKAAIAAGVSVAAFSGEMLLALLPWVATLSALFLLIEDFITWQTGGESLFGKLLGDPKQFDEAIKVIKKVFSDIGTDLQPIIKGISQIFDGLNSGSSILLEAGITKFTDAAAILFLKLLLIYGPIVEKVIERILVRVFLVLWEMLNRSLENGAKAVDGLVASIINRAFSQIFLKTKDLVAMLPDFMPGKQLSLDLLDKASKVSLIGGPDKQSQAVQNNFNMTATFGITVPEGTSVVQQASIQEQAKSAAQAVFTAELAKLATMGGYNK